MRLNNIFATLLFSICTLLISSCNDDDSLDPISLKDMDISDIKLNYPASSTYTYPLQGGDGNYKVNCNKPEVVDAQISESNHEKVLCLTVQALGDAIVTITDDSQNTLVVNVKVDYYTQRFVVSKQDVFITGDLRDSEKKAITEKALETIPVKVSGGYKFIYTDPEEPTGKVLVYKEKYGGEAIEGTFKRTSATTEHPVTGEHEYHSYELTLPGEQRVFIMQEYKPSERSSMIPLFAFYEDVKDRFTTDYPLLERVHTAQVITQPSDLFY